MIMLIHLHPLYKLLCKPGTEELNAPAFPGEFSLT